MRLSPPIATLIILAVLVSGTVWLAPPQVKQTKMTVQVSAETYQKLALRGKSQAGSEGQGMTVEEVIEKFANNSRIAE